MQAEDEHTGPGKHRGLVDGERGAPDDWYEPVPPAAAEAASAPHTPLNGHGGGGGAAKTRRNARAQDHRSTLLKPTLSTAKKADIKADANKTRESTRAGTPHYTGKPTRPVTTPRSFSAPRPLHPSFTARRTLATCHARAHQHARSIIVARKTRNHVVQGGCTGDAKGPKNRTGS